MISNNISLAFRQLKRQKLFAVINIFGLALSMVACLLIYKYVTFERSYDNFHEESENVFRLYREAGEAKDAYSIASIFPAIAPNIKANYPEIERAARFIGSAKMFNSFAFTYAPENGDLRTFNIPRGYFADGDALDIFSLQWLNGNAPSLHQTNELVISESYAKRFFGDENAVGKVLSFKNMSQEYKVTGVFKDLPINTHFKFDLLCSFSSLPSRWDLDNDYGWGNFYTYVRLANGANRSDLHDKVNGFLIDKQEWYRDEGIDFKLQPIEDIHLKSNQTFELEANGNERAVNFLSIIGIFIMIVAWVNYINLSTSKLVERAREVGVRKVLGGHRAQLVRQFLTESFVVNLIAIALALTILQVTIGFFEALLGIPIAFVTAETLGTTLLFIAIFSFGSLLFGFYPAFLFSKLRVTQVLKGRAKSTKSGLALRKGLTVFQFVIALILITGTISVYQQLQFMKNQSLGMDIDQTLVIKKPFVDSENRAVSHRSFVNQLSQMSSVNGVSGSSEVPGNVITRMRGVNTMADGSGDGIYAKDISIDDQFLDVYNIQLLHGSDFSQSNRSNAIMLNESAARDLFGEEDLSTKINQTYYYLEEPHQLIGIIADFNQESLKVSSEPHIYSAKQRIRFYSVKLTKGNLPETLAAVEGAFNKSYSDSHFDYFFLDDHFNRQYKSDRLFGEIFTFFSILAIAITGLGLFGLSIYNIGQRSKEISIRKVLGASIRSISLLLSREYFVLLIIASMLAMPAGYFMIDQWLSNFASRMPMQVVLFVLPLLVILAITLISVGYQVAKAAISNPADSLRYE